MTTRNLVPRANEEGNIGSSVKNWLKAWFKDLYVSGVITDGADNVTVAGLKIASDDAHEHANKALLDTYTQTEADLADAVSLRHDSHLLGTKTLDEDDIDDTKFIMYDSTSDTLVFRTVGGAGGVALSEVTIDINKDWQGFNITNIGTVDGRDISLDGAKLDGIQAGAVSLATVKADADIADAVSLRHDSHLLGTKTLDETDLANEKFIMYDSTSDTLVFRDVEEIESVNLSELVIDVSKNWGGFNLTNLGSVEITNTLEVSGAVSFHSTLDVLGATTISNTLQAGSTSVSDITTTGSATVGTTLGVTEAATLSNTLKVTGHSAFGDLADIDKYYVFSTGTYSDYPSLHNIQGDVSHGDSLVVLGSVENIRFPVTVNGKYVRGAARTYLISGSNDVPSFIGISLDTNHYGTGTITESQSLSVSNMAAANGAIETTMMGIRSSVGAFDAATVGAAECIRTEPFISAGSITNAYGLKVNDALSYGGTITNQYGIYIENQTKGSSLNYPLYIAGGQTHSEGTLTVSGDSAFGPSSAVATNTILKIMAEDHNSEDNGYGLYIDSQTNSGAGIAYGAYIGPGASYGLYIESSVFYGLYVESGASINVYIGAENKTAATDICGELIYSWPTIATGEYVQFRGLKVEYNPNFTGVPNNAASDIRGYYSTITIDDDNQTFDVSAAGMIRGIDNEISITNSHSNWGTIYGIYNTTIINNQSTNTTVFDVHGFYNYTSITAGYGGDAPSWYGINNQLVLYPQNSAATPAYGIYNAVSVYGIFGGNEPVIGMYIALNGGGTVSGDLYGIWIQDSGATPLTVNGDYYGIKVDTAAVGTVSGGQAYGLYIVPPDMAGTNYGVYIASGADYGLYLVGGITYLGGNLYLNGNLADGVGANASSVADIADAVSLRHDSHLLGTKTLDEDDIDDTKFIMYDSTSDTLVFRTVGGAGNIINESWVPIEWSEDGTSAPDAAELITSGNGKVRVRKFAWDSTKDVIINWPVPEDIDITAGIQYQVDFIVTDSTADGEGVSFKLAGYSIGDNDSINGVFGTAVKSNKTAITASQYDRLVSNVSGTVTITDLAAGELAVLKLYRDHDDTDDTYTEDIGVMGIRIFYRSTTTNSFPT